MSQNQVVRIVSRCVDPFRRATLSRNDPESHERILFASFGIVFHFERLSQCRVVADLKCRHFRIIKLLVR